MKITKPKTEVQVCDFCRREEGYLQACWVCGKEFCLCCDGHVGQSYGFLTICEVCAERQDVKDICEVCAERQDVKDICDKYAKKLVPIFRKRDNELKALQP